MTFNVSWNILAVDKFSETAEKVSRSAEKVQDSLKKVGDSAAQSSEKATASFSSLRDTAKKLAAPLLGGIMVKSAASFERSMNDVRAITDFTGERLEQTRKSTIAAAKATVSSLNDAGMAAQYFAGYTNNMTEETGYFINALTLATATERGIIPASELVQNTLLAMSLDIKEQSKLVDILAHAYRTGTQDISVLGNALSTVGKIVDMETESIESLTGVFLGLREARMDIGESSSYMTRAMIALQAPSAAALRAIKRMQEVTGKGVKDASGKMLPILTIMENIKETIDKANISLEGQGQLYNDLFGGRPGVVFRRGVENIDKLKLAYEELSRVRGTAARMAEIRESGFSMALTKNRLAVERLYEAIISPDVLSFLEDAALRSESWTDSLTEWVKQNNGLKNVALTLLSIYGTFKLIVPILSKLGILKGIASLFNPVTASLAVLSAELWLVNKMWPEFFDHLEKWTKKWFEFNADIYNWLKGKVFEGAQLAGGKIEDLGEWLGLRENFQEKMARDMASERRLTFLSETGIVGKGTQSILTIKIDDQAKYVKGVEASGDQKFDFDLGSNLVAIR